MKVEPVVLEGEHVRLEPLGRGHQAALAEVALEPALWRFMLSDVRTPADLDRYITRALEQREAGRALPFAIIERASGRAVGSTRFASIEPAHRRVEIGSTWIASRWQRTAINTGAKYLMLRHAFETWGCIRVQFRTDTRNAASRRALERIGAREEATLRRHGIYADGTARDIVCYAVIEDEWPAVRTQLERLLARA